MRIHVRRYPQSETVLLDGMLLIADQPCEKLTNCFNSLYASTKELVLNPGEHVLATRAADSMHLPAVVFSGSFVYDESGMYADYSRVEAVPFFGRLSAKITFSIPETAKEAYISLGDQPFVAQLELDGRIVAESSASTARLTIPPWYIGKTVTGIVHTYSSMAPIFGDVAAADARLNLRVWWVKGCAASRQEKLDLRKLTMQY